jgi:hypothetical protein
VDGPDHHSIQNHPVSLWAQTEASERRVCYSSGVDKLLKFFALEKVDEAQRIVYGVVAEEAVDTDGEIWDYETGKPLYQATAEKIGKASDGENIMPLREMHQLKAVGAGKSMEFDDAAKKVRMSFKVVDDTTWKKVCEKVLLGFSHGGKYLRKWSEHGKNYYTSLPGEVSLVDHPSMPGAFIEYVKVDGSKELFKTQGRCELTPEDLKNLIDGISDSLSTRLAKTIKEKTESVEYSATGATMKPEEIKKCAAALGITEEEFTKKYLEGDLAKGAKGMAALHSHLETAMAHHEAMSKAHDAMGAMHDKMGTHLGKCMKSAKDVMGSESESEKAFKAAIDELKAAAAPAAPKPDTKNAELDAVVKAAVDAATKDLMEKVKKLEEAPAPSGVHLFSVEREGAVKKALEASDPLPV